MPHTSEHRAALPLANPNLPTIGATGGFLAGDPRAGQQVGTGGQSSFDLTPREQAEDIAAARNQTVLRLTTAGWLLSDFTIIPIDENDNAVAPSASDEIPSLDELENAGLTRAQAVLAQQHILLRLNDLTGGQIDDIMGGGSGGGGISASAANAARAQDFFQTSEFPEAIRQFESKAAETLRSNQAREGISGFEAQSRLGLGLGDLSLNEAELRRRLISDPDDALARILAQSGQVSPFGRVTLADQLNAMGAGLNTALGFIPGGENAVFTGGGFTGTPVPSGGFPPTAAPAAAPPVTPAPTPGTGFTAAPVAAPAGGGFTAAPVPTGFRDAAGFEDEQRTILPPRLAPPLISRDAAGAEDLAGPARRAPAPLPQPAPAPVNRATLLGPRTNPNARGITEILGGIGGLIGRGAGAVGEQLVQQAPLLGPAAGLVKNAFQALPDTPAQKRAKQRELDSLSRISGLVDVGGEPMAGGGFTRAPVLRVGENPKGGKGGFEETIFNPTGAPLLIDPSKKAKRMGAPGFATGTFRTDFTQGEIIETTRAGLPTRVGDVLGGRAPQRSQIFGSLSGGAPTPAQLAGLSPDEKSILNQFLQLGTETSPGIELEDLEFSAQRRHVSRRTRPRARQNRFSR